ncbi:unnamed protein product [Rotaria socialis]|uniref:F-box domain-containing protein n=1 Tax=Rotaria socialis TaxID=392032 RepID=A0A818GLP2_9BILA|nr:unnamed protein product [Rotaria socialis]CAF4589916.1 unnamed protein product [Rotaria socialis]
MSLSKLESLPNEILCDIIEKYINGVDLLSAFSYQLNQRFDAIISRSERLRFNFIQCHQDDFRICMGLLRAYIDKIEQLAISERETPGQVEAFLSFFPRFTLFRQLRTLYFDFDYDAVSARLISRALNSLLDSNIKTLSITAVNMDNGSNIRYDIPPIFTLKSLKRFTLRSDLYRFDWSNLMERQSNIQYLTVSGMNCALEDLVAIFKLAPRLKYLDVATFDQGYNRDSNTKRDLKMNNTIASSLHTLILSFSKDSSVTIQMLTPYFNCMPILNRLEIKAYGVLMDADAWRICFETSLPLLTHFYIRATISGIEKTGIENVLASFQTSYWVAKKNFNIMITEHENRLRHISNLNTITLLDKTEFDQSVTCCWIAPDRTSNNELVKVNRNICWKSVDRNSTILHNYYFDNVKIRAVDNIDKSLFQWLTKYVNCGCIKELIITAPEKTTEKLTKLVSFLTNINFLYISFDLLVVNIGAFKAIKRCVKHLNISHCEHTFNEQDIIVIGKCFPYLEHLNINTKGLYNVPLIKRYLKYLRSLTFEMRDYYINDFDDDSARRRLYDLHQQTRFLFSIKNRKMTVWMDQTAFDDSYWQTFAPKPSGNKRRNNSFSREWSEERHE